mmetsp:Transcript_2926/g.5816  ORF Transcript_2926/g.5816 Transcript_2926/m.5816 type:complete len:420 (-) Transcript_2926:112-1371(-)
MDGSNANNECGICLGEWTNPVKLPCGHSFCADCLSGWKPKYVEGLQSGRAKDQLGKCCPLCRGTIPPSREEIANMKMAKTLMREKSHLDPEYYKDAQAVKKFEAAYGEDWDGTMIEYDNNFVSLPHYVGKAICNGNIRTALQWLGKGNINEKLNAKSDVGWNTGLLHLAAVSNQHDFMGYLLLKGADVNILNSKGMSALTVICRDKKNLKFVELLLSWGAEHYREGKQVTKEMKLDMCGDLSRFCDCTAIANLMSLDLGGRRCEIVSVPDARSDLVGKTCVVDEYIKESDQYKVKMEFTNEVLQVGADNLKRRDRTPRDPGYYVENKNNRLIRRDFMSNEECRAFVANLGTEEELAEVDPDAESKAEQAAADLLAELGLDDLEDPSTNATMKGAQLKGAQSALPAGKKKKRGGKKKGRK